MIRVKKTTGRTGEVVAGWSGSPTLNKRDPTVSLQGHMTHRPEVSCGLSPPPLSPPLTRLFPFPPSPVRLHLGLNRKYISITSLLFTPELLMDPHSRKHGVHSERSSYLPGEWRRSRGTGCYSYRTHRSSPAAPHSLEPHSPGAGSTNRRVSRGRHACYAASLNHVTSVTG